MQNLNKRMMVKKIFEVIDSSQLLKIRFTLDLPITNSNRLQLANSNKQRLPHKTNNLDQTDNLDNSKKARIWSAATSLDKHIIMYRSKVLYATQRKLSIGRLVKKSRRNHDFKYCMAMSIRFFTKNCSSEIVSKLIWLTMMFVLLRCRDMKCWNSPQHPSWSRCPRPTKSSTIRKHFNNSS